MRSFLLIFAFVGQSFALQGSLEYLFRYSGVVQTGFPDIKHQYAIQAIKFDVIAQVQNNGRASMQFSHIMIAEFHGDVGCDPRNPHLQYHPADAQLEAQLGAAFEVDLKHCYEDCLKVSGTEKLWVLNFRKGVVSFFRNEVIQGNFQGSLGAVSELIHAGDVPPAFSLMEDTIHGRCRVDYTLHKLPETLGYYRDFISTVEVDVQNPQTDAYTDSSKSKSKQSPAKKVPSGTKTSGKGGKPDKLIGNVPKIDRDLWHLIRSTDFDDCEERVSVQRSPSGIYSSLAGGQLGWLQSRSSVAEYLLRGLGGSFRIERATIEGAIHTSPFGTGDDLSQAATNQTLQLVSVKEMGQPIDITTCTQKIKTVMYEVMTYHSKPDLDKYHPWVRYSAKSSAVTFVEVMTGVGISAQDKEEMTKTVIRMVREMAVFLNEKTLREPKLPMSSQLLIILYYIRDLPKENIEQIFKEIFSKKEDTEQMLLLDAVCASGSPAAVHVILERIKKGQVPNDHVLSMSMTLSSNLRSPSNLPDIFEWIKTIDLKANPMMGSTVLVNFANQLKKLCVEEWAQNIIYGSPILGNDTCEGYMIVPEFVNFLITKYKSTSEPWVKDVMVQTLSTLGSPLGVPALVSVLRDHAGANTKTRAIAAYALSRWQMPKEYRTQIMTILIEVFSNHDEEAEVRKAALAMLTTWSPKANFWNRLARLSWREPSRQMAAYIYSTIQAVADIKEDKAHKRSSKAAAHALRLAKPVSPSLRFSHTVMKHKKLVEYHLTAVKNIGWFADKQSVLPKEFYMFFMSTMGGFDIVNLEFGMIQEGMKEAFFNFWTNELRKEEYDVPTMAKKIAKDFFDKITDSIKWEKQEKSKEISLLLFFRFFSNMFLLLPLNQQTVHTLIDPSYVGSLAMSLMLGKYNVYFKFINPIDNSAGMPSDMGLPAIISIASPSFYHFDTEYHAKFGMGSAFTLDSLSKMDVSSEDATKIDFSGYSELAVLVPWNKKFVGSVVRANKRFDLAANYEVITSKKEKEIGMTMMFAPHKQKDIPVLQASTTPMTISGSLYALSSYPKIDAKPVISEGTTTQVIPLPHTILGVKSRVTWTSAFEFPINIKNIKYFIQHPQIIYAFLTSPTIRLWNFKFEILPEESPTHNITFTYGCTTFGEKKEEFVQYGQGEFSQDNSDFGQYDQEASGPEQFSQSAQHPHQSGVGAEVDQFSQSLDQRSQKLQTFYGGELAKSCSFKLETSGIEKRFYEIFSSWSAPSLNADRVISKGQIAITRGVIPGVMPEASLMCLDWKRSAPSFSELNTLESLFARKNLDTEVHVDFLDGCKGEPLSTGNLNFRISAERLKHMKETLKQECDFDPYDPTLSFHNHAKIDKFEFDITWQKLTTVEKQRLPAVSATRQRLATILSRAFPGFTCANNNDFKILGVRALETDSWQFRASSGDMVLPFPVLSDSPFIDYFLPIGGAAAPLVHGKHMIFNGGLSTKCFVKTNFVRSFDGFTFNYTPSPCFVVIATDCVDHSWVLLGRQGISKSDVPELRFIDMTKHLVIDISKDIRINGKVINPIGEEIVKDKVGKTLCVVQKNTNNYILVGIPFVGLIVVKDHVELKLENLWRGHGCGLCGNFDVEDQGELIGPKGCVYKNPDMFAASWMSSSDTCDLYTLLERREPAEEYQKSCITIKAIEQRKQEDASSKCAKVEYMHYDYEGRKCVSSYPVFSCRDKCVPLGNFTTQVRFRCRFGSQSKSPIQNLKGYLLTPTKEEHGGSIVHIPFDMPTSCRIAPQFKTLSHPHITHQNTPPGVEP